MRKMITAVETTFLADRTSPNTIFALGFAILLLAFCSSPVKASAITYTYTGNDYQNAVAPYTLNMSVTGSFTFAAPLPANLAYPVSETPVTWSISDGVDTITNQSGAVLFSVGTDSLGNIKNWVFTTSFNVSTGVLSIFSENPLVPTSGYPCGITPCDAIAGVAAGHAVVVAAVTSAGVWAPTFITPEPSSVFLMTIGLFALAYTARKRLKSADM